MATYTPWYRRELTATRRAQLRALARHYLPASVPPPPTAASFLGTCLCDALIVERFDGHRLNWPAGTIHRCPTSALLRATGWPEPHHGPIPPTRAPAEIAPPSAPTAPPPAPIKSPRGAIPYGSLPPTR